MSQPRNYIADQNRFKLAGPPKFWLNQLWDFDSSLVVVPSRQGCYYRLAQRRRLQLPEHIVNEALFKESDTQMLSTYGLVPVTTILATANWSNPLMFEELRQRAPWRNGGADKVNAELEIKDQQREMDKNVRIDERNTDIAKDAWKMYNKKIGLRSQMYSPVVKKRQSSTPPANRAPAIIITGSR